MRKSQKNSVVLANFVLLAEDRPLSDLELRTFKFLAERSSIEEIEKSIYLVHKSQSNPSLRGQLLRDKPRMLKPQRGSVRYSQRKRGYTDKGHLADEGDIALKKVLNESLISLDLLEDTLPPTFLRIFYEFTRGHNWFSLGDWEDFLDFVQEKFPESGSSVWIQELVEILHEQLEFRKNHPFRSKNSINRVLKERET